MSKKSVSTSASADKKTIEAFDFSDIESALKSAKGHVSTAMCCAVEIGKRSIGAHEQNTVDVLSVMIDLYELDGEVARALEVIGGAK